MDSAERFSRKGGRLSPQEMLSKTVHRGGPLLEALRQRKGVVFDEKSTLLLLVEALRLQRLGYPVDIEPMQGGRKYTLDYNQDFQEITSRFEESSS